MSGLSCLDLRVRLGRRPVLHGVSLSVRPGEILALVGPNGAGKSTLLRALAGELVPQSGRVTLDGQALHRWDPRALALRRAVLPQRPRLDTPFTVSEVVRLGRHPHRSRLTVDDAAVHRALIEVGMRDRARDAWTRLSGGEQQRVALARTLAQLDSRETAPKMLLLDEPTSALDLAWQHRLLDQVRRFAARGNGVLIVLHDLGLAAVHADRTALLHEGRLIAIGSPRNILTPSALARAYGVHAQWVNVPNVGPMPVVFGAQSPSSTPPLEVQ